MSGYNYKRIAAAVSKYRQMEARQAKREEGWTDLPISGGSSEGICAAPQAYLALRSGLSLLLIDAATPGRLASAASVASAAEGPVPRCVALPAHSSPPTEWQFAPFLLDDELQLASMAPDEGCVKVWRLPARFPAAWENGRTLQVGGSEVGAIAQPLVLRPPASADKPVCLAWHTTASSIIAVGFSSCVAVFHDERLVWSSFSTSEPASLDWSPCGSMLAVLGRDGSVHVHADFSESSSAQRRHSFHNGAHTRHARVRFVGSGCLLTLGWDAAWTRSACFRALPDDSTVGEPVVVPLDTSTQPAFVQVDADARLVFVAVRGSRAVRVLDLSPGAAASDNEPLRVAELGGAAVNLRFAASDAASTVQGLALLPKRSLDCARAEVDRAMVLTGNAIVPCSFSVPRKSHAEFPAELFPPTNGLRAGQSGEDWLRHGSKSVPKIDLADIRETEEVKIDRNSEIRAEKPETCKQNTSETSNKSMEPRQAETRAAAQPPAAATVKLKFISAKAAHNAPTSHSFPAHILAQTLPPESSSFLAVLDLGDGSTAFAFPIVGSGGRVAVLQSPPRKWEVRERGCGENAIPSLIGGSEVTGLLPLAGRRLVTAAEDGRLRIWQLGGAAADPATPLLAEDRTDPDHVVQAHAGRITLLERHPHHSGLVLTGAPELGAGCFAVGVWDMQQREPLATLRLPLAEPVLAAAFAGPRRLLLASKSAAAGGGVMLQLRAFSNGLEKESVVEAERTGAHGGSRACRIVYLFSSNSDSNPNTSPLAITVGFTRGSERECVVWDAALRPLATVALDSSPAPLNAAFVAELGLLLLAGKGDSSVLAFEYTPRLPPYLHACASPLALPSVTFGLQPAPRPLGCDVARCEVLRTFRVAQGAVETHAWEVPRVRREFFQDDLFPPVRRLREERVTPRDLFWEGANGDDDDEQHWEVLSLQPSGMQPLSEVAARLEAERLLAAQTKKYASFGSKEATDMEQRGTMLGNMFKDAKTDTAEREVLVQDKMEGVDSDEWDD